MIVIFEKGNCIMIMNGKNIILNLRVTDLENEKLIYSDYYGSIEELNSFLQKNSIKEPVCSEIIIDACLIKDDVEITLLFSYELSLLCVLDDDEIEDFNIALYEHLKPIVAELTPKYVLPETSNGDNKAFEKLGLSAYRYLCPGCWNEIEKCTCNSYPYFLIQIDTGISEIVKTLNIKGYLTAATCEGHLEQENPCFYINFKEAYGFELPQGFYWEDNNIRSEYSGDNFEELTKDKNAKLESFAEMVRCLPYLW